MNYDLFIQPAVLERACVSTVSSEQVSSRSAPHHTASGRAAVGGIDGVANPGPPLEGSMAETFAEKIERAVAALSETLERTNVGLEYRVDDATGDMVISVIDRDSGEVLRQLPPEEILKMRQQLQELMGVLFDVTA